MPVVRANGIDIHYVLEGSGPVVTLSHSLTCHLAMWRDLAGALAGRYTVLRYDVRGHGESSAPAGNYGFDDLVADVLGLFDALDIARSHWVGVSMGGMIGQHLALTAPDRVERLVIANSSSRIPPEAGPLWDERIRMARAGGCAALVEGTLARWFTEPFRAARPDVMARVGAQIAATPVAGFTGCAAAIRALDITARLPEVRARTRVIAGSADPGTPPAMSETIAGAIPGAELRVIAGASHLACLEQPEAFHRLVAEFLED